ncbi:MAG: preprotein translocase subunit SecE [Chloroflexi bacterium]|nr:preprotein translocase subunit SecE [Chloroflexota bacterium]MCL5074834.1 preprotein translocase subunit SecE [Chloroflexota bacterium]
MATKVKPTKATVAVENRFKRVIRETRAELRKIAWPTRDEATNLTIIVIAISIAVGLFLGGVDYVLKKIFELLFTGS